MEEQDDDNNNDNDDNSQEGEQHCWLEKTLSELIVPFVYLVHNRVGHFEIALDTLLASDFCRNNKCVPLIIMHNGHIPNIMLFVEELKTQFSHVIQMFHSFSYVEHPNSFPG